MERKHSEEMKRILVVEVNWLGDAVLTTPIFKAIKQLYPHSYVAVMAVERVAGIFEDSPYIDEVILFDERGKEKSLFSRMDFVKRLKSKKFDTVFLVHRSFTRALVCLLAGIKERIGYRRWKNLSVLTKKIAQPKIPLHRGDYYFYLFEQSGIKIKDKTPETFIPKRKRERIDVFLREPKMRHSYLVGINPSANWELKQWPQENFARLCDRLIKELNCGIFLVGKDEDKELVEKVITKMQQEPYNFCGKTDLEELGALIERMALFVSNDSGPAHLAAALGTNTLVLFGPTSPQITAPWGQAVRIIQNTTECKIPCYNTGCRDNVCMKNISVDEVFLTAKGILKT